MKLHLTAALALALVAGGSIATVRASSQQASQSNQQAPPEPVYDPGNGVTFPKLVKQVQPKYTEGARNARIQGAVELKAVVTSNGTVGDVTVLKSLDQQHGLDDEAVKAAKQWQFEPGTKEGKPVATRVTIIMEFKL
jgi:protein TonB